MGGSSKQKQQSKVQSSQPRNNTQRSSPPPFLQQHSSSSKFELEPNPFEQSFNFNDKVASASRKPNVLPPVAAIDSPSDGANARNNPLWETLRSGELSPSMLGGPRPPPQNNDSRTSYGSSLLPPQMGHNSGVLDTMNQPSMQNYEAMQPNNLYLLSAAQQEVMRRNSLGQVVPVVKSEIDDMGPQSSHSPPSRYRVTTSPESSADDLHSRRSNRRASSSSRRTDGGGDDTEKRKNFLERNRQAALKCRQRKKQWLAELQNKVEYLSSDNEKLQTQATSLREEIINLKTLLLAHKDCTVAQANGVIGLEQLRAAPGMLLRQNVQNSAPMNMFGGTGGPSYQHNPHQVT
ncbi:hypothetical protein K450DRAFT_302928 [Umbelopsis ramanniana AG]|uniref:BZIP domain-containing protein n=1 Tax=Umbelopsis ramanniana AG TaxID=1314678 RepID=A0AAD5H9B3_UMBRA|nr:uncharacterized protein K450DRAFT_302928 [Umbelopsis ramanniana AG]KAI8576195.1 hypothetical protein K450DRAFT_302928 [Umbelopsis ramanniana AG]